MKLWMDQSSVGPFLNIDRIIFEAMRLCEESLRKLPESTHKGHETCLLAAGTAIRRVIERDVYDDKLLNAICNSCTHHIAMLTKKANTFTWENHFELFTWHAMMGAAIALRCASGFISLQIEVEGDKIEPSRVGGVDGLIKGLVRCLTFLSALRHCAESPDLTYKSSLDPKTVESMAGLPGFSGLDAPQPQWLVDVIDAGTMPEEPKPSRLFLCFK